MLSACASLARGQRGFCMTRRDDQAAGWSGFAMQRLEAAPT
jgi:hypothetical protein